MKATGINGAAAQGISSKLSIKVNFSWTLLGNVVYAACQWLILVVLAKVGAPEMVGKFALGLAIVVPIMSFGTMKTRLVQVTDANREYMFSDYLKLRIITTFLAFLIIALISVMGGRLKAIGSIVIAIGIIKAIESISDVIYGLLQQRERMDLVSKSLLIRGPLALIGIWMGTYLTGKLLSGVMMMGLAYASVMIIFDVQNAKYILCGDINKGISAKYKGGILAKKDFLKLSRNILSLAWMSFPLGFVVTMDSLRASIPSYFIAGHMGQYELGIFASMAYLKKAGNMIIVALGISVTSKLAKYYANRNIAQYRRLLLKATSFGMIIGFGGVLISFVCGKQLMAFLYGVEFSVYKNVLVILMVAACIDYMATFLDYGINAARYFRIQVPLMVSVMTTCALGCLIFVPLYGLEGGALAITLSALVRLGFTWCVVLHAIHSMKKYTKTRGC